MANENSLQEPQHSIQQILEAETNNFVELAKIAGLDIATDFADADLSGVDLRDADLSRANLSGADLTYADLSGANLTHADLSRADLSGANLIFAKLSGANLSGVNLGRAKLSGADLSRADLRGAKLRDADLRRANLRATDLRGTKLKGAKWSLDKLSRAKLMDTSTYLIIIVFTLCIFFTTFYYPTISLIGFFVSIFVSMLLESFRSSLIKERAKDAKNSQ
ncbi:pentapeptide repeat-containing protein [Microcoleus sp. S36b_A4]|uniref:pentapeptide repeat-containing protein n=1 Tax=Microcoleus sp. S36b_A4 TaxID=3055420 RepID=UPI002FD21D69